MTEVLPLAATASSPSPRSGTPESASDTFSESRPWPLERVPSYAQKRMSEYSRLSQSSRPQSSSVEFPAFSSSLPYALVRDFAYPVFHPLHYGAALEPSGTSTPSSEWNPARRQSAPDEQWYHARSAQAGGWSAGPWGGDGVMFGDPEHDDNLAALPSTSFSNSSEYSVPPLEFTEDEVAFKKGRHRKSKSYGSISDFERGRRRESGRRSRGDGSDTGIFWFHGQQNDPRMSRQRSGTGSESNGGRKDSRNSATLANRSFHHSYSASDGVDPDGPIPLDAEPHTTHSPQRASMGPEDEELFAGPSLALYSFEPENSNELRLEEGQEIMVSYRHGQGWLVASDPETGEQGLVPEAYVRLIADMPNYDPETGQFVDLDELEYDESSGAVNVSHDSEMGGLDGEAEHLQGTMDVDKDDSGGGLKTKVMQEDEDDEDDAVISPSRRGAVSQRLIP